MDNNVPDQVVGDLSKNFKIVGTHRVHSWYAWAIVGIVFGMALGIVYVANQSGQFAASQAAQKVRDMKTAATAPATLTNENAKMFLYAKSLYEKEYGAAISEVRIEPVTKVDASYAVLGSASTFDFTNPSAVAVANKRIAMLENAKTAYRLHIGQSFSMLLFPGTNWKNTDLASMMQARPETGGAVADTNKKPTCACTGNYTISINFSQQGKDGSSTTGTISQTKNVGAIKALTECPAAPATCEAICNERAGKWIVADVIANSYSSGEGRKFDTKSITSKAAPASGLDPAGNFMCNSAAAGSAN